MRKIVLAAFAALAVALAGSLPGLPTGAHAASGPKVVIIVGPVEAVTSYYRSDADAAAAAAAKYTDDVVKVYSPNATWANVLPALQGASIVIYLGHGNGFPSPYFTGGGLTPGYPFPQDRVDGLGLNVASNPSDYVHSYIGYGETGLRTSVRLAPNAVVILSHLCYSAGNNETWDTTPIPVATAQARADNMAAGWIAAGARAVIADVMSGPAWYVNALFTNPGTIDQVWKSAPDYHGNLHPYPSTRSPGMTAQLDTDTPITSDPTGNIYHRSLVSDPSFRFLAPAYTPPPTPATYTPMAPQRVLDSRLGLGVPRAFSSGIPQSFQVAGAAGVPTGASAVTGNLTVTGPTNRGYIALTPTPTGAPSTSTLNFPAADTRANGVTVPLGPGGALSAVYITGRLGDRAQIVFDVTGFFMAGTAGSFYVPVAPARVEDTRTDGPPLASGVPASFPVAGKGGVPGDAVAVTGNVTVTAQTSGGYVALTPQPTPTPATSTINFPLADTRANGVTVPLGPDGSLSAVYITGRGGDRAQLIFDVTGYFTRSGGASYVPLAPARFLDTRIPLGATPLVAGTPTTFATAGQGGVPTGATAVTGNVTVVGQTYPGYVALTPQPTANPTTSTINFPLGDIRANNVDTPLGTDGALAVTYVTGRTGDRTQLVFDVTGFFR